MFNYFFIEIHYKLFFTIIADQGNISAICHYVTSIISLDYEHNFLTLAARMGVEQHMSYPSQSKRK